MRVRVLAFAGLRETLGASDFALELRDGSLDALWEALSTRDRTIGTLRSSTRVARNGTLLNARDVLAEGDEIALLPPVGGG